MNTNTQIDKIDKVLSKISGKEMKNFVRQYAATHEDFATALFVGETLFDDIKRMALLKEKPKEFAWLVDYVKSYMGLSAVVDKTIKEGIKQLIAEYPDKYYFKSYLGSLL